LSAELAGRRALVTGGTRGIGRGIVSGLVDRGASVVFTGRDTEAGRDVSDELAARSGRMVTFAPADLRDRASVRDVVASAAAAMGGLDILCHCAGIYPEAALPTMSPEMWHDVLDTNLTSAVFLVQEALPALAASSRGRVILISSISGPRTGIAGLSHYCASKAGLEGFARAAAVELAPSGITVNCVAPGTILTEGLAELYSEPGVMESVERIIPVGRLGRPADIANAVAFFAAEGASFVTGQSLVIDGGQTLPEVQG
jgi:3-oxoacyl-[acyl-carrier protein] reductase